MALMYLSKSTTQQIDVLNEQPPATICQIDRKEETSAFDKVSTIAGHVRTCSTTGREMMGFAALYPSYRLGDRLPLWQIP